MFERLNLSAQSSYLAQWARTINRKAILRHTKTFFKKIHSRGKDSMWRMRYYGDILRTRGGGLRTRVKEVRGSEVMRLLDDRENLHNRMKKNRLCGFFVSVKRKNYVLGFPYFPCFLCYLKSWKTQKIWKT